jgi:hypothetical protein
MKLSVEEAYNKYISVKQVEENFPLAIKGIFPW